MHINKMVSKCWGGLRHFKFGNTNNTYIGNLKQI